MPWSLIPGLAALPLVLPSILAEPESKKMRIGKSKVLRDIEPESNDETNCYLRFICCHSARLYTYTTDFGKPFAHCMEFLRRRGIVAVISDFHEDAETVVKTMEPLRYRGNEVIMLHVLDPQEVKPKFAEPVITTGFGPSGSTSAAAGGASPSNRWHRNQSGPSPCQLPWAT